MKVGDLVYWTTETWGFSGPREYGIIIDEHHGEIKVVDLCGDLQGSVSWWNSAEWKLVEDALDSQ